MLFLFDYGDEWRFRVTLTKMERRSRKSDIPASLPRAARRRNNIPIPIPAVATYGINLATGEKIKIR